RRRLSRWPMCVPGHRECRGESDARLWAFARAWPLRRPAATRRRARPPERKKVVAWFHPEGRIVLRGDASPPAGRATGPCANRPALADFRLAFRRGQVVTHRSGRARAAVRGDGGLSEGVSEDGRATPCQESTPTSCRMRISPW